jgi:tetratricopeptide (TPR) repeat protein
VPDGLTGGPTSKEALAAELRRLMLAAERRPGGRGRLKRSALARSVGVSASSLYAYLDGTTLPPTDVLDRLLAALDVAAVERGRLATARDAIETGRRSRANRSTTGDDHTMPRPEGPPAPRQLLAPPQMFTGRVRELSKIEQAHDASTVVITAIDGMAGVGKTALAVYAGHRIADRYPDGQLLIDLHGFTEATAPVEPGDALDRLLRALGVPGVRIPAGLEDRAGLWRSVLSERRILIVLDNAATEAQVAPLLPGAPGCLVLVTSRRRLTGLDATHTVSLDTLPPAEARALLTRTVGADRLTDQPGGLVAEVTELCGRLPLAIRIAAARLRSHPTWSLADLAKRLRDQDQLLSELADGTRGVDAALELSTRQLNPEQQRMYRRLGLHPGPDADPYAAAALAEVSLVAARRQLEQLHDAHLLQEPTAGRFVFHDLVRAHASQIAAGAESEPLRRAALTRLFDHYRLTASVAMDVAYPYERERRPRITPADVPTPDLSDPDQATGWLDIEHPNLLAAARHAAGHGWPEHALDLSVILHRHLRTRGRYGDAEVLHHQALTTARAIGDRAGELSTLTGLGWIHLLQGRYEQAADHYQQALQLARTIGDRTGELNVLRGLGWIHQRQGRHEQAADHYQQALEIARATGDRAGELDVRRGLAHLHLLEGRHEQAADHYQQALEIARNTGNRTGELSALNGLAHIHRLQGRPEQATDHHQQALEIARTIGDHIGELNALNGLAHIHLRQGRPEQATDHYQRVLDLARATGDRNWEFEALHGLGRLHYSTGSPDAALPKHRQALELATDLGHPDDQARAHDGLAHAHHALHQPEQARQHWQQALAILTSLGTGHTEDELANTTTIRTHLAALADADPAAVPGRERPTGRGQRIQPGDGAP